MVMSGGAASMFSRRMDDALARDLRNLPVVSIIVFVALFVRGDTLCGFPTGGVRVTIQRTWTSCHEETEQWTGRGGGILDRRHPARLRGVPERQHRLYIITSGHLCSPPVQATNSTMVKNLTVFGAGLMGASNRVRSVRR